MPDVTERRFEDAIEATLLAGGPDAAPDAAFTGAERAQRGYGEGAPGGWSRGNPKDYDRAMCLFPRATLDFIIASQPKEWEKLRQQYGAEVEPRFLRRLSDEIARRGALDVLRTGIKDVGARFQMAFFAPSSGLNAEVQRLYELNVFTCVRQVKYSERNENCLDVVLFLNGIPLFTAELKNPLTSQTVEHAIRQYKFDRDPREPLFAFRRCLAHFAVDPDLVYVTTKLAGPKTRFLPFNQGKFGGAGNPPVPPTQPGYPTSYLWDRIWARDSVLNLVRQFVHEVDEEDEDGRKTGNRSLIFPRYHQLDTVRRLVTDARSRGAGRQYLVQHSAGSGKSNTIAWLAHQLSVLHNADDQRVFDSIVVVTDRKVLDRQLQGIIKSFEQTLGVVENIDQNSGQLKDALASGKTIIVSTLQKFPMLVDAARELPARRFALIVDEAHSSQSGETTSGLKQVLASGTLEEAEREDKTEEELDDRITAIMKARGRLPNVSTFAFTATPKQKTLELFGDKQPDGQFAPFSLYSMRQAIEEKFILDVLQNYATYKVYWSLLKTVEADPHYDRNKATYLLRSFVDLEPHAIERKLGIILGHFAGHVAARIAGQAKAMIVTRSRKHAVRFKLALDKALAERRLPFKALVAFSGEVKDEGASYTEAGMNGFPEAQTRKQFRKPEYRFLVVAEKFQTGFDQPLLHTMYVDKKLTGVNAVQTLSRLNRTCPDKEETCVLDFANDADEIAKAFQPFYERTLLKQATDPNLLYDLQHQLLGAGVFTQDDVDGFAKRYFAANMTTDQLYALLAPAEDRFKALAPEDQFAFRSKNDDYVRLYSFLAQLVPFADADLEKLYAFARLLRRRIPPPEETLPREIQENIDMEAYSVRPAFQGAIGLERGAPPLEPIGPGAIRAAGITEMEPLSRIIQELNERFGTQFTEDDKVFIQNLETRLGANDALKNTVRVSAPANAKLSFQRFAEQALQEMVDTNFQFYKRVTDEQAFAEYFLNWLFERYRKAVRSD